MRYFILQYWAADNALLSAGRLFVRYTGIGSTDTRRAPCERVVFQNRCPRLYTLYPQSDAAREPLPLCPRRAAHSLLTPSPPDDPRDDDDGAAGAPSSQLAVFRPKPPATRWTVPMHSESARSDSATTAQRCRHRCRPDPRPGPRRATSHEAPRRHGRRRVYRRPTGAGERPQQGAPADFRPRHGAAPKHTLNKNMCRLTGAAGCCA